jgi:hypothetical protein
VRARSVGVVLLFLIGCPTKPKPAAPPPSTERPTATEYTFDYTFEDDLIEGDLIKPDGDYGTARDRPRPPAILAAQNQVRADHCAAPMVWSPELELRAMGRARALADRGCDRATTAPLPGENLTLAVTGPLTASAVVARWAREEERVDFRAGRVDDRTRRFTQLVWKDSLAVGCAPVGCGDRDGWVCVYEPPGNVDDGFALNVAARGCR